MQIGPFLPEAPPVLCAPDAPALEDFCEPAGTLPPDSGVEGGDHRIAVVESSATSRAGFRSLLLILLASVTLLGEGERCRIDPRFASPSATLLTFWEAMRTGDAEEVWECFVEGRDDLPMPGMLSMLPPTERLSLAEFRALPVTSGRILVRYEVHFVPRGFEEERIFVTGDELVRVRGQWRIARPIGQVSTPTWESAPQAVDI